MSQCSLGGLVLLLAAAPLAVANAEAGDAAETLWTRWSATLSAQYRWIESPQDDDDVGGFFDQYEFTPNKSSAVPFEFGLRDGAVDLFRGEAEPLFQLRFQSPTSNLGISGSEIDQPFLNQRLDALARLEGLEVDLSYRRARTEQLRLFPNTEGPGLLFGDLSSADDRFFRDRTGFRSEIRLRPYEAFGAQDAIGSRLAPELSLRGGYQDRDGDAQLRFLRDPSNDWIGLDQDLDRSVSDIGGGLLLAPDGLLTLAFDFDYQRFRFDSGPITEGELGFPPPLGTRSIGFVPSSNRYTGSARFNSRIGERAVLEGSFQISELEQVASFTPDQAAAGLKDNSVRYYAADASVDVALVGGLSFIGTFEFDRRENDIERDTVLFNDSNGSQIEPFVESWRRFFAHGELELRMRGANRVALGVRYEDVSRDLDFPQPGNLRILPENAHISRDTQIVTVFGRTALRAWRSLNLSAELGYRTAPETGYIVELDDNFYGQLRASYLFRWRRPLSLSAFVRGSTGDNGDFSVVSGLGPDPSGSVLGRSYESSNVAGGITASISPVDRLSTYLSFFYAYGSQDTSLDLSTLQRSFQEVLPIGFERDGKSEFEDRQLSLVLGSHLQLTEQTDGRLSYGYTHAKARYRGGSANLSCLISGTSCLELIAPNRKIESDIHTIDFEVGHWLRDGLRVLAGYRLQHHDDGSSSVQSVASAVRPFDRSTHQHSVTLGVTLTSDFFSH
ncbi:MAG: hypothetical protein JRH16_21400 [Deltaproteobacteria bacterium]|nr:hypothetical protein [Deltaproteobacteria bacterium]MBW2420697.1 hypothetical protein [Deltaproteobacteria bacterium]